MALGNGKKCQRTRERDISGVSSPHSHRPGCLYLGHRSSSLGLLGRPIRRPNSPARDAGPWPRPDRVTRHPTQDRPPCAREVTWRWCVSGWGRWREYPSEGAKRPSAIGLPRGASPLSRRRSPVIAPWCRNTSRRSIRRARTGCPAGRTARPTDSACSSGPRGPLLAYTAPSRDETHPPAQGHPVGGSSCQRSRPEDEDAHRVVPLAPPRA